LTESIGPDGSVDEAVVDVDGEFWEGRKKKELRVSLECEGEKGREEGASKLTRHDRRRSTEKRVHEEVEEPKLTLSLKSSIGILDD